MKRAILGSIAAAAIAAMPLWAQEGDLFAKLDKNGDGVVSADEVEGDAKGLFERSLRRGDKDGDKKLTKEEFAAAQSESDAPRQPLGQGAGRFGSGAFNLRQAVARMDANKDGKLSKEEAQGPIKESFDRFDGNSDGVISEDELARIAGPRPDGGPPGGAPRVRRDPRQVEEQFARLDANSDGKLTKDELSDGQRETFGRMLEREGGSVTKEQFVRLMTGDQPFPGARPGEPGRPGFGPPGGGRPPLFVALDADNDGELSASEIEAASKALIKLDRNEDGKLSREELFPGSPDGPPRDRPGEGRPDGRRPGDRTADARPGDGRPGLGRFNPEEFQARLKEADKNGDGKLTKDEAPPMLKERFDRIDANGDGVLDEADLRQMLERLREGGDRPQGRPEGRPDGRRPEGDRPAAPRG